MWKMGAGRFRLSACVLAALVVVAFLTSFLIGRYGISVRTLVDIFLSRIVAIDHYWEDTL